MKPSRAYVRSFVRMRDAIERQGVRMIRKALAAQYRQYLELIEHMDMSQWEAAADRIQAKPIEEFFERFYPMAAKLGVMERSHMMGEKAAADSMFESAYEQKLRDVVTRKAGEKITSITETTRQRLIAVTRATLTDGAQEGWGVDKIARSLRYAAAQDLGANGAARARAIAQTEMISASNQATTFAVEDLVSSTGMTYKKYWSTSGLSGVRESHMQYEAMSDNAGGFSPDYEFAPGLKFPGDPDCSDPADVINCRCTILHELQ